jgi:hypothetical protein
MALPFAALPAAITIASEFFPDLIGKLGGKRAGAVAERVVATAARAASLPPDASPNQIAEALRSDDAARAKLRLELAQLDQEEYQREIEDREAARQYQLALGAEGRSRGNIMLLGVSIALLACILVVVLPSLATDGAGGLGNGELALVTTVAGALLKMLSDAFAFEFGSSRGSKEKDEQIFQFQKSLERINQGREVAARDIMRAQEERIADAQRAVFQNAARSTAPAVAAAIAAETAGPRDFVAQLVRGEV